jgi:hypothetical protein
MNVAYYSHYFTPEIGAPSARIYDLAQQWLLMGHEVQAVTCFPNHPSGKLYPGYKSCLYARTDLDGICVHRHWTYITPNKGFVKKTLGHLSYLPSAFLANRHLTPPDITIGSSPTLFAAMAAAAVSIRRKIPFVMEVRDLWPAIFVELGVLRNRRLIRWLERLEMALYRRATRVVTVTDAFRRNLIERGVPAEKVFTIPNGADVTFWQPTEPSAELRRRLNLEGRFVVLYLGAHGISHALGRILESAEQLRACSQIRFLFVGEGAEKAQLVERAREARLDNIQFLDPVDKNGVKEFYALADVCLVPLRNIPLFEGFIPSKMFEIMAMGRPIIASLRGEAADILRRTGGAIVVEPEDSDAISQAIMHLYHNKDQARTMAERGRSFVFEHYSRRSLAASYAEVLREAVSDYHSKR